MVNGVGETTIGGVTVWKAAVTVSGISSGSAVAIGVEIENVSFSVIAIGSYLIIGQ